MKLKLIKEYTYQDQTLPVDSVIEIEDEAGQALIADGTAIAYTEEVEAQEQDQIEEQEKEAVLKEVEAIKIESKSIKNLETKTVSVTGEKKIMNGLISKKIKDLETKAVTGAVDLGPVDGSVIFGELIESKVVALANTVQTEADSYKVLYAAPYSTDDTDADIDIVAEATESETTTPIKNTQVNLGKIYRTAYISREVSQTVDGADQSVKTQIGNKATNAIEKGIYAGAFTTNNVSILKPTRINPTVTLTGFQEVGFLHIDR